MLAAVGLTCIAIELLLLEGGGHSVRGLSFVLGLLLVPAMVIGCVLGALVSLAHGPEWLFGAVALVAIVAATRLWAGALANGAPVGCGATRAAEVARCVVERNADARNPRNRAQAAYTLAASDACQVQLQPAGRDGVLLTQRLLEPREPTGPRVRTFSVTLDEATPEDGPGSPPRDDAGGRSPAPPETTVDAIGMLALRRKRSPR